MTRLCYTVLFNILSVHSKLLLGGRSVNIMWEYNKGILSMLALVKKCLLFYISQEIFTFIAVSFSDPKLTFHGSQQNN